MNNIVPKRGMNRDTLSGLGPNASSARPFRVEIERDESFDVTQLWATLRDNRKFVLGIASTLFFLVMLATMISTMAFKSSGRLYLGELDGKGAPAGSNDIDLSGGGQGDVSSEIEILKSQSLLTRAILDSGLNASVTPVGWKPPRFYRWWLSGRDPELLAVPENSLLADHAQLAESYRGELSFRVHVTGDTTYTLYHNEQAIGEGTLEQPLKTDVVSLTLHAGRRGNPHKGEDYTLVVQPVEDVVTNALGALTVTATAASTGGGESAKVVLLEFSDKSPRLAATFLRTLMDDYLDQRQAWKTENATAAETFVTRQLAGLRASLDSAEKQMAEYRAQTGGVALDGEAKSIIDQVGKYEEQRVAARLQVASLADIHRVLKEPNPPLEAYLLGESSDTVLVELASSLSKARQELTALEGRFASAAPEVRQQRAQVEAQLRSVRNYVSTRLARAQENLNALNQVVGQFETKLKRVPGAELGLAQLTRETEVYSRVYSYMLERQQQAAIVKASTVSKNRILDLPQPTYREDAPKLGLRLISAPLFLIFGALVVLGQRFFAATFQSESEVRRAVGYVPVYASIPRRLRARTSDRDDPRAELEVSSIDLTSGYTEAFRTLRTNLHQLGSAGHGRVVTVTSAQNGDGKTTSVFSFAATLAAEGKRVLVVDADFRNPTHHALVGRPGNEGMRDILMGDAIWQDLVWPVSLTSGDFHAIAAGQMAPAELLSSDRMTLFLAEARTQYDYVLLDAPSFPQIADALLLASVSDQVLTVVRLQNTLRKTLHEHVRRMSDFARGYALIINDSDAAMSRAPSPSTHARLGSGAVGSGVVGSGTRGLPQRAARNRFLVWTAAALLSSLAAALIVKSRRNAAADQANAAQRTELSANRTAGAGQGQSRPLPHSSGTGHSVLSAPPPDLSGVSLPSLAQPQSKEPEQTAAPAAQRAAEPQQSMLGNPRPARPGAPRRAPSPAAAAAPARRAVASEPAAPAPPKVEQQPEAPPPSTAPWGDDAPQPPRAEPLPDNPF
jgi:tyrosine-protein kinase Etk/Wzc